MASVSFPPKFKNKYQKMERLRNIASALRNKSTWVNVLQLLYCKGKWAGGCKSEMEQAANKCALASFFMPHLQVNQWFCFQYRNTCPLGNYISLCTTFPDYAISADQTAFMCQWITKNCLFCNRIFKKKTKKLLYLLIIDNLIWLFLFKETLIIWLKR